MNITLVAISVLVFASSSHASAADLPIPESEIPEFHQISETFYRGGHPSAEGLHALAEMGVKTVIDLENDEEVVLQEQADAARANLHWISRPMSRFWAPSDALADEILGLLADPALRPIFLHCTLGQDRTGLMAGLYLVITEKREPAAVYQQMLQYGFKNRLLFPLDNYFRARTGYDQIYLP